MIKLHLSPTSGHWFVGSGAKSLISKLLLVTLLTSSGTASETCSDLSTLLLPDVRITEAVALSDSASLSGKVKVPHCKVSGVIGQEIHFEAQLPEAWNGRFFMGGGGGYVGSISNDAVGTVNKGYASIGTDAGHRGSGIRAKWAVDHPDRVINFGHLAIHRTAEVGKELIRAHYGSGPEFSYFKGCSAGGGQAMMESQRYPDDFDGIIAISPAFNWTSFTAEMIQNSQLSFPNPATFDQPVITQNNLALLESAILGECDELDGVIDGILDDPRECLFDLSTLPSCPKGYPAPDCLTAEQRAAIESVYAPVVGPNGQIHPGQPFGGENDPRGWAPWIAGEKILKRKGTPTLQWAFGTEFYKYFVYADAEWDYRDYDFDTWQEDTKFVSEIVDATDTDLSAFKASGGRMIIWHGWSDAAMSALATIEYYEAVEAQDSDVRDYLRMYLLPGVMHCGNGPGPSRVDWDAAIVEWVEHGKAPGALIASKRQDGQITMTRPLCVYPERAVYIGSGSTDEATSFECRAH